MKQKKCFICMMLCGIIVFAVGCGTQPYDLTEKNQDSIANYAAHVLTKYNSKQAEGLLYMTSAELEDAEKETKKTDTSTKTEEKKNTDSDTDSGTDSGTKTDIEETVTLEQALNLENGLTAVYQNYDITDSYVEGSYFSMNATSGKTYLVLHIQLKAEDGDVSCDMLSKKWSYRIVINDEKETAAQTSILLNDLGTYQGTIVKDQPVDCVLLFELPKESVEGITSLSLKVQGTDHKSTVNLQ